MAFLEVFANDQELIDFLEREWESFLEINDSPNTYPVLLWETSKAVLTGIIISYCSH